MNGNQDRPCVNRFVPSDRSSTAQNVGAVSYSSLFPPQRQTWSPARGVLNWTVLGGALTLLLGRSY